ncbi:uncharacterized protein SCHCODRAFT_02634740 [Schizophyllum commune H4-8]|uniref:uncharacterized protein n=1 Tax=Schizophyllum commune (strain H4-8 / FGSC 9210) TaxID=578458 RepID=UPI00215F7E14|nr:uncharacterized protein SCHCODRAFT_02634740 [Schizophyllum commune H4-8]KAI5889505.1 hypothetical protein SCHCODRAFT_02634740 [Schizophyllum commune H4-8]
MVSRSLLVFTIGIVFAGGASAADQASSSDKGSISRGTAAGILIALACTLTLALLLLERRRKRKIMASRARFMESRPPRTPLPSRRPSTHCRSQPWRISPSLRRDGDPALFMAMEIVAPPPTYDAALRDKQPPYYQQTSSSVISAAKSEPSIATQNQEGPNPC